MDLKERNKQHLDLSISNFNRIKSVFEQNGWPIYDRFGEDTFGDFCNMFAGFEEDQFEMMISLTERFLWVNENDYPKYFIDAFNKFINSFCFANFLFSSSNSTEFPINFEMRAFSSFIFDIIIL